MNIQGRAKAKIFCLLFCAFFCFAITAAPSHSPRIGLALSGGGARGLAHIGVLKALDELHVPVHYIAGTSMGSIVGGLYAFGLPAAELEKNVLAIDWQELFDEEAQRHRLSLRSKQDQRRYFLNLEFGLTRENQLSVPTAAVNDQALLFILKRLTRGVELKSFSDLPIPYRAVATDINKAESVVLDKGDLALAMRASMAVPFVFSPVIMGDKVLVDGGALNNLPVDVVKGLGADVVIAVNISSPLEEARADSSLFKVSQQTLSTVLIQNTRKSLQDADLVITPDLTDIKTYDFTVADKVILQGYKAVHDKAYLFKSLALDPVAYAAFRQKQIVLTKAEEPFTPQWIHFHGHGRVNTKALEAQTDVLKRALVKQKDIENSIWRTLAGNDIQQINFRVREEDGQKGIEFEVTEKPWGPNYFRFGINAAAIWDADFSANAILKHERLSINDLGAEWHNTLILGSEFLAGTEFYQPLDHQKNYFVAPQLQWNSGSEPIFQGHRHLAEDQIELLAGGIDVGRKFKNVADLRVGLWKFLGEEKVRIGEPRDEIDIDETAVKVAYLYDSLDDRYFARKGLKINAQTYFFEKILGGDDRYQLTELYARRHFQVGQAGSVIFDARYSKLSGDFPIFESLLFGGFNDFAGYEPGELSGDRAFIARLGGMMPIVNNPLSLAGSMRFLAFAHAGDVSNESLEFAFNRMKKGAAAAVVWDTAFGILLLGTGYTESGDIQYYLAIGNLFDDTI